MFEEVFVGVGVGSSQGKSSHVVIPAVITTPSTFVDDPIEQTPVTGIDPINIESHFIHETYGPANPPGKLILCNILGLVQSLKNKVLTSGLVLLNS